MRDSPNKGDIGSLIRKLVALLDTSTVLLFNLGIKQQSLSWKLPGFVKWSPGFPGIPPKLSNKLRRGQFKSSIVFSEYCCLWRALYFSYDNPPYFFSLFLLMRLQVLLWCHASCKLSFQIFIAQHIFLSLCRYLERASKAYFDIEFRTQKLFLNVKLTDDCTNTLVSYCVVAIERN